MQLSIRVLSLAVLAVLCAAPGDDAYGNGNGTKNQVWSLVSDTNVLGDADDYSGIEVPGNGLRNQTFSDIESLSADFFVQEGDCGGGSPRFQIALDTDGDGDFDGNVFVYLGPYPNFTGCPLQTWESSGNLVEDPDNRWDTTQVGGTFYDSHAGAVALVGDAAILGVSLVVDAGWFFATQRQVILVDDARVNSRRLSQGFGGAERIQTN